MLLKNNLVKVNIEKISDFKIDSTDNVRNSKIILNPGSHKDFYIALYIEFFIKNEMNNFIFIGAKNDDIEKCIALENSILVILTNNEITKIDLYKLNILKYIKFNNSDNTFELHKLNDKYLIYGEQYIRMLNEDLSLEWEFISDDIITSFKIENDTIKLIDCNNTYYELNINGKIVNKYIK